MSTFSVPMTQLMLAMVASGHVKRQSLKGKSHDDILSKAAEIIDTVAPFKDESVRAEDQDQNEDYSEDLPVLSADEYGRVGQTDSGFPIYSAQFTWPTATFKKAYELFCKVVELELVESEDEDEADFEVLPLEDYSVKDLLVEFLTYTNLHLRPELDSKDVLVNADEDADAEELYRQICDQYFLRSTASIENFFAEYVFFSDVKYVKLIWEVERASTIENLARKLYINSGEIVSNKDLNKLGLKMDFLQNLKDGTVKRELAWTLGLPGIKKTYLVEAERQLNTGKK